MKKKKGNNIFWFILISLFVCFVGLYVAEESGYYETKMEQKTTLTDSKMRQFESDIKSGKNIDINDYITEEKYDFQNKFSKAGIAFSNNVDKFMNEGIKEIGSILKKLFGT